jgi:peptide/nickel transport system permease protein
MARADEQRIFVASQWQLMWWRFRKHKVAVASGGVVIVFYLVVLGADFLAYADPNASEAQRSLMPPHSRARVIRTRSSASIARTRR